MAALFDPPHPGFLPGRIQRVVEVVQHRMGTALVVHQAVQPSRRRPTGAALQRLEEQTIHNHAIVM